MPTTLTRVVQFRASHHLWRADWSAAQNREAFGPLTEPHDHDYRCAVTIAGPRDPRSGMITDLAEFDRILAQEVHAPLHGRDLNRDLPHFAGGTPIPTCEALAAYLFGRIVSRLPPGLRLERVRIAEDPSLYADCTGLE